MPRLARSVLLMSAVLLTATPVAIAKEVTGMKICGRDGCAALKRAEAQRFHNDGTLYGASLERDPGRVRHYRLVMLFGDGNGGVAGRVALAYAPQQRAVLALGAVPAMPWQRVSDSAAGRLNRLAGGLAPLAGSRLPAAEGTSLPPEVWEPWRDAEGADADDGGGLPRPLLAGVPAALAVGLGLVWAWRRPRAGSQG